jgi:hypothetical protein
MILPKKAPYADTTSDPEKTIGDINRMLQKYGIKEYQWTTLWDKARVELRFGIEVEGGRKVGIKVVPPAFARTRRTWNAKLGRNEKIVAPNWAQSLRCLHYWLKAKVEAVAYGLREVEEEFLSDIIVLLPTGEETTVGEAIRPGLASGDIAAAKDLLGSGRDS